MNGRTFFPRANSMPYGLGYLAMYRFYDESPWTIVPGRESHPSVAAALKAAESYMRERMNPQIRTEHAEPDPIEDEVSAWRRRKEEEAQEERAAVFGTTGPAIIFAKGGRQVQVERRKKVRA